MTGFFFIGVSRTRTLALSHSRTATAYRRLQDFVIFIFLAVLRAELLWYGRQLTLTARHVTNRCLFTLGDSLLQLAGLATAQRVGLHRSAVDIRRIYNEYVYSPLRQNTPRNKYKKANTKKTHNMQVKKKR